MKNVKLFLILSFFLVIGCNANESFIENINPELEIISFDVVEKKLIIEEGFPENMQNLITKWFDDKVKINGFEGEVLIHIYNYKEKTSPIDDGKRVDSSLSFKINLNKSALKKEYIKGSVNSYGTISGNFSLQEFDTLIQNTQVNLIERLTSKLISKI